MSLIFDLVNGYHYFKKVIQSDWLGNSGAPTVRHVFNFANNLWRATEWVQTLDKTGELHHLSSHQSNIIS